MAGSEGIPLLQAFWYFLWRHWLLGDFHGYFILIIFQFYALFLLFQKHAKKFTPRSILIASFVINVAYLGFFNFTKPVDTVAAQYIWDKLYWVFSPGWIFYFTVAYYLGRNEAWFREKLKQFRLAVYVLPVVTGAFVLFVNGQGWITAHSSKRIDMLLFAMSMILLLFTVASSLKKCRVCWSGAVDTPSAYICSTRCCWLYSSNFLLRSGCKTLDYSVCFSNLLDVW